MLYSIRTGFLVDENNKHHSHMGTGLNGIGRPLSEQTNNKMINYTREAVMSLFVKEKE